MLVAHFVSVESLNLQGWTATSNGAARNHLFQTSLVSQLPTITQMQARINGEQYPALYQVSRTNGANGGSAILDYQIYEESCKQVSEAGSTDFVRPYLPYTAYTDTSGLQIYTINLTQNNQSVWDRTRQPERANMELSIQFASPIPTAGVGLVISLVSSEAVSISSTGNVGVTF